MDKVGNSTAGVFLLFFLFSFSQAIAQKNSTESLALGLAGILAAAWEIDQFLEHLELQAVQQVLESHPTDGAQSFRVKVFSIPGQKITDISKESMLVFSVNFYDVETQAETARKILFAHTSPGWMNEYGIEYSLLEWVWYDVDQWNELFARFVDISTPLKVEGLKVPYVRRIEEDEFYMGEDQFFLNQMGADHTRRIKYYSIYEQGADIRTLRLSVRGFEYGSSTSTMDDGEVFIPHLDIGRDQYVSGSLGGGVELVANENALGLYRRSTGRLVQLRRVLVNDVHAWVNEVAEKSSEEQYAESLGLRNAAEYERKLQEAQLADEKKRQFVELTQSLAAVTIANKTGFDAGDKGYFEIFENVLVRCSVISARIDMVKQDFAVNVQIDYLGELQEMSIRSGDPRVIWVTDYLPDL